MSDIGSRPHTRFVGAAVVFVLLVVLIVVGVARHMKPQQAEAGGGTHTSTPGSTPSASVSNGTSPTTTSSSSSVSTEEETPIAAPAAVMDDLDEPPLPEAVNPVVSDEPQPSASQIWAYELAYFTPNPVLREQLMKPLATEQYLAEDLSREPAKVEGIEVHVVEEESEIVSVTVGANHFTAFVITNVFLETVRDGEVVNRFVGPQHASAWVNTENGWRVIKNVGEG